jgi:succinyl-CoA synthetase beta subunit
MAKRMLSEFESYDLLKQYGVPVPEHAIVQSAVEAGKAAEKIGFPVVMKIHSPQIIHKSDAGGVIVSISSKQAAEEAFTKIVGNAKAYNPEAEIKGVIVEQQAAPGLELIIGGKTDPAFGKVLTFGMGGTLVELMRDVTLRILPISEETIRQLIKEIHGYPMIQGYRGTKPRDEETLVKVMWADINCFFAENTHVVAFDINPRSGCIESGACIVDDSP